MTLHDLRRNYTFGSLVREKLPKEPLSCFTSGGAIAVCGASGVV